MSPSKPPTRARRLSHELAQLRRPIVLATRHDFQALDRVEGLERRAARVLSEILDEEPPRALRERLDRLSGCFIGFDQAGDNEKKARLLKALSLIDRLMQLDDDPGADARIEPDRRALYMSVQYLKGVGPKVAELLAAKNLVTVEDLIFFLPRRYQDRRNVAKIAAFVPGDFCQGVGTIAAMSASSARFGRKPYEIAVHDESGVATLLWFHYGARYIADRYKVGDRVRFGGKVSLFRGRKQIAHPDIEPFEESDDELAAEGVHAVYPEIQGIAAKKFAAIIAQAVDNYAELVPDPLPERLLKAAKLPGLADALAHLHRPDEHADLDALNERESPWHMRLAFDELFYVQLALARRRLGVKTERGYKHRRLNNLATRFYKRFPYKLTDAQRRTLGECVNDLTESKPMNRLLQGDVGSGKTIVAVLSALLVVENGRQVAFMAPTEVLAEQHFQSIRELCDFEGVRVALLTGEMARAQKLALYEAIENGEIDIVIGTHALIQRAVAFKDLGYVIIDEQHRFGVNQRALLAGKGARPDCLVMTATPIPRSLSLTLYGDLDVSIIDELPKGRQPIETKVLWMSEQPKMLKRLRAELAAGRQAYVITPLVSESEKMDLTDAETEQERLQALLPDFTVGLLHGRMHGADKERIMRAFKEHAYDVLVSTSVVEVGVDVPNASMMVVQHAERFGLSQLHQLRGRVGRGDAASACFLMVEKVTEDARERLSIMEQTGDGFKIAERDLEIRGPGDFLGTRQVGAPLFVHANLARDQLLLQMARKLAFEWIEADPDLKSPESEAIRQTFESQFQEKLKLIGIG